MSARPLRSIASVSSTLALVAGGIAAATSAANAVETPGVDNTICPGTPVWTGGFDPDADVGKPVHGLTTTHGVTPEAFSGTYVSTLKNGAGRGKDIFLFRMEGSRITKTNADGDVQVDAGIWAGMSGSPVYDADDNLVGSVSYGFSGAPSNLAGITPAADIIDVQNSSTNVPAAIAPVPKATRSRLAAASASTTDTESTIGGMRRLALPRFSVGVAAADGHNAVTPIAARSRSLATKLNGAQPRFHTGSQYDGSLDPVKAIVPGGNIATAWSHGDVALAAVGTITAVCGDKVFAYGHPDNFDGDKATETFHAAYADEIQEDSAPGSYKLASIDMDPIGQITQDRLSGIMGVKGQLPAETTVTTNTTLGASSTTAQTKVSTPEALSTAVGSQLFNDALDGLDAYAGGGEAVMTWSINYTPRGGAPATYTRSQRVSVRSLFAEEMPADVAGDIEFLQYGSDTRIAVNSVTVNTTLAPDYKALRLSGVDIRSNHQWVKTRIGQKISAKRGANLQLRVRLSPADSGSEAPATTQLLTIPVAKSAAGTGQVRLSGGLNSFGEDDDEFFNLDVEDSEEYYADEEFAEDPLPLPDVLALLASQRRNDSIRRVLSFYSPSGPHTQTATTATPSVTSGSFALRLGFTR